MDTTEALIGIGPVFQPPRPDVTASWPANLSATVALGRHIQRVLHDFAERKPLVNAIMSHAEMRPLEPLPADGQEGQRLRVEKADDGEMSVEEIDRDYVELARLCEASEVVEEEQLERALQEAHCQAKEQVRRQMGLA
jgi:hypothetical protein